MLPRQATAGDPVGSGPPPSGSRVRRRAKKAGGGLLAGRVAFLE